MNTISTSPRFSSLIRFVKTNEAFDALVNQPRHEGYLAGGDSTAYDFEFAPDSLTTDYVIFCNAGGLRSEKMGAMFHIYPTLTKRDGLEVADPQRLQQLSARFNSYKQLLGGGLRGLLVGGASRYPESTAYANHIRQWFREAGIPFSQLWGHRNKEHSGLYFNVPADTWQIRLAHDDGSVVSHLPTLEAVRQYYERVEIAPGDTLMLDEETVKG